MITGTAVGSRDTHSKGDGVDSITHEAVRLLLLRLHDGGRRGSVGHRGGYGGPRSRVWWGGGFNLQSLLAVRPHMSLLCDKAYSRIVLRDQICGPAARCCLLPSDPLQSSSSSHPGCCCLIRSAGVLLAWRGGSEADGSRSGEYPAGGRWIAVMADRSRRSFKMRIPFVDFDHVDRSDLLGLHMYSYCPGCDDGAHMATPGNLTCERIVWPPGPHHRCRPN